LVQNNILKPEIVSEPIEDDISKELLGEKSNESLVEKQPEIQQEQTVESEVESEIRENLKIQFLDDVMVPDAVKSFVNEVVFLQQGRFQRDMKVFEGRIESRLRKEFEMKLEENRLNLSEISEEYMSEGKESNGTVKDANGSDVKSVGKVKVNESLKRTSQIEISSDEEEVTKKLVGQLQRQIDEESFVEVSQEKVVKPKVTELLVKLKRKTHKRVRNSDSDSEGETGNSGKRPVRRQRLRKRQSRNGSRLIQDNQSHRLNDREIAKEAEMKAECLRMKKIADDDRK
jgi:hypothetical protein